MAPANTARLGILICWNMLLFATTLFSQQGPDPASPEQKEGEQLGDFITAMGDLTQAYSLSIFQGNELFAATEALSATILLTDSPSAVINIAISEEDSLSRITVNDENIILKPAFSLEEEESLLLQKIDFTLPSLPLLFETEQTTFFELFTGLLYLLYRYDSTNSRLSFFAAKIEIFVVEGKTNTQDRPPASPLLVWPKEEDVALPAAESRILLRLNFDSDQMLTDTLRYRYDSVGRFYELQRRQQGGEQRFVVLNEETLGSRELILNDAGSLVSLRRFDDQGRLRYVSRSDEAVANQSRSRIRYLNGGGREEIETFLSGGEEQREYDANNNLLSSLRVLSSGQEEGRLFTYTEEGDILLEEYHGILGDRITTYRYEEEELSEVVTTKDGVLSRRLEIDGDRSIETRYVRGRAVLRVYLENDTRVAEEELFNDEVLRRREYTEVDEQ